MFHGIWRVTRKRFLLLFALFGRVAEFTVFPTVLRNSGGHRVHLTERFISLDRKKLLLQLFCLGARSPYQCKVAEHAGITWIPEANRKNPFLVTFHLTWNMCGACFPVFPWNFAKRGEYIGRNSKCRLTWLPVCRRGLGISRDLNIRRESSL